MVLENGGGVTTNRYSRLINWKILAVDIIAMEAVFWLFFFLREEVGKGTWTSDPVLLCLILAATLFFAIIAGNMVFLMRGVGPESVLANVFKINLRFVAYSVLVLVLIRFNLDSSRWLLIFYVTVFLVIAVIHLLARRLVVSKRSRSKAFEVVMVGVTDGIRELSAYLDSNISMGTRVAGYFSDKEDSELSGHIPYLGTLNSCIGYLDAHKPSQVFCALPAAASVAIDVMKWCRSHVVLFSGVPDMMRSLSRGLQLQNIGGVYTMSFINAPLSDPVNRVAKRTFDIVASGLFLCTLFPFIFVFVAIGTKLSSPGPIFFRQKRTGLGGEDFECLKFRSMRVNAQADTLQATEHDPRKTKFGDFIRKTSLDEFPQFINVFKGDMSIVGPRPHMLAHTEEYSALIDKYMMRHFVKPGITGWAQVSGCRGETKTLGEMEARVKADVWYIENWSFWLDIVIIFKTFVQVFLKGDKQAY